MEKNNLAKWMNSIVFILHWATCCCQTTERKFDNQRFIIAILLPVHNIEYANYDENIIRRGGINKDMIQLIEAAYYAKDFIQRSHHLPPNVTLDIVVKDYTDFPRFGVNESDPKLFEELCWFGDWVKIKENLPCFKNGTTSHLVGIIYSENVEDEPKFQTILQSFPLVPRISYSGPPKGILVNEYLRLERGGASRTFNTVSSGSMFTIDVIFELLKHNNWTYVALQYTTLGLQGIRYAKYEGISYTKRFQDLAIDYGICIAHIMDTESVLRIIQSKRALWEVIPPYNTVQVIVCICTEIELIILQTALIAHSGGDKRYVVIGVIAEGANIKSYFISSAKWRPALVHMNIIVPHQTFITEFKEYFSSKSVQNNQRNPWFKDFWEQQYKCEFEPTGDEKKCNGTEQSLSLYEQHSEVPNMIKSIFALALSLNNVLNDNDWHEYPKFWIKLSNYTNEIKFNYFGEEVSFTQDGLPRTEKFEIKSWIDGAAYVKTGEYVRSGYHYDINQNREKNIQSFLYYKRTLRINGTLLMNDTEANFPSNIKSTCSDPCLPGHAMVKQNDTCCWKCDPCDSTEILNDPSTCTKCDYGNMSNENKTACIPIPIKKTKWNDINGLISTSFSLLCIALTVFTSGVFIKYRNTPAVKSTTRELCHVMFAGMILANLTPFVSIISLDAITCGIIRFIPAVSFTMIYAALLVKTNRIARLLAMSKKKFPNLNPKFMSLKAQVIITSALIGLQILVCLISLYFHRPEAIIDYKEENNTRFGIETCNLDENVLIETFLFVAFLVVICANYAIKTRNLPENFNEAKRIGFAVYATILTGMAFALVYFNSEKKMLAINMCVSINSLVILIFLFIPKLYIILWQPEKNTKSNFITAIDIRSYQGNEKRSHSNQKYSKDYKLKEMEQSTNDERALMELVQHSVATIGGKLTKILIADQQMILIEKNESEDDDNLNTLQKTYAIMVETVKSCQKELNHLQKEMIKQRKENQYHVNKAFVNSE